MTTIMTDAHHLTALVRGMPADQLKQELIDQLSDAQLLDVLTVYADRLVALVRGTTAETIKAELVDKLPDPELITILVAYDEHAPHVFARLWDQVRELRPQCQACHAKHWPGEGGACGAGRHQLLGEEVQ